MIYQIYPKQDATIYEKKPNLNSGIDALLEITKIFTTVTSASVSTTIPYCSRILMKFDYADLSDLISAGFNTSSADNKYILKLYATEDKQLPASFSLEVDPISGSWNMGLGRYDYIPYITEGVSWNFRYGITSGVTWKTSSFVASSTGSWNLVAGGGNWYTTYTSSKTFDYNQLIDPEIEITNIVNAHLINAIPNQGIIIRRPTSEEAASTDEMNLKFFSSDTNTIYLPHLQVKWNDWTFNTGSLNTLTTGENVIYFKNLKHTFSTNERIKFRPVGRPKYPVKTFSTTSMYSTEYYLPASSSYSVEDVHTKEVVIPHDNIYTRISCDPEGSYFNLWLDSLQPERWYKFTIKCKYDNGDVRIYDRDYIFKVQREV